LKEAKRREFKTLALLEHRAEKWVPVFGKKRCDRNYVGGRPEEGDYLHRRDGECAVKSRLIRTTMLLD
jgi:hypothetical protein